MKKLIIATILVAGWLTIPTKAQAWHWGKFKIDAGMRFYFHVTPHGAPGHGHQAGPWYLYWPLEAHFQQPAPGARRAYAGPQTLPPSFGAHQYHVPQGYSAQPAHGTVVPKLPSKQETRQPVYKPVSWNGSAPAYWYPHH